MAVHGKIRDIKSAWVFLALLLVTGPLHAAVPSWTAGGLFVFGDNYITGPYGQVIGAADIKYKNFAGMVATGVTAHGKMGHAYFSGLTLAAGYTVPIPHFPFELRLAYNFSPHWNSTIMEQDLALFGSYQGRHLATGLGWQVRFNDSLDGFTKYVEYQNYIYLLEVYIWPRGHRYNISLGVKNYDILNYGLDPRFNLTLTYKLKNDVRLVIEGLYQGSGVGAILFNYYDWKVRFGVLWGA